MKSIASILVALLLSFPVLAETPVDQTQRVDPEARLDVAVTFLDRVLENTVASLNRIAAAPEAQHGNWAGIKPQLEMLKVQRPGAYFYIKPSGDYYTVARDFTNLNLGNRPYFGALFSGSTVRGYPVYSRSTGKKSAVVAVPVVTDGHVSGAIGVSIFLEPLKTKLERTLALPANYTWFVLNAKGDTMLHKDSDHIFMNALTQGSPSLHDAAAQALQHDSGTFRYSLERPRDGYYKKLPHLPWRMVVAKIEGPLKPAQPKLTLSLERFVPELQHELDRIDDSVAQQLEKSSLDVTDEHKIRDLLRAIYDSNQNIIDSGFVDTKGILRYLEPEDYKNFENSDISSQAHIIAMRKSPRPLVSGGFLSAEHFLSTVIARPVYDGNGRFSGAVTVLIRPEIFIDTLLKKSEIPDDYELWVMQPEDGMIIYDQDKNEIGRLLFDDPMYTGYGTLLELGRKIAAAPSGEGSYVYLAPEEDKKVIKRAVWRSVRLHNRQWRVVLAYRPYE